MAAAPPPAPSPLPPYCCVLLHDGAGPRTAFLFMERRDGTATTAAGHLTCFGGKREHDEAPCACIAREVREELAGWTDGCPTAADFQRTRPAVLLYVDGALIAYFYAARAPTEEQRRAITYEKGRRGEVVPLTHVGGISADVSPWHAAVIESWRTGKTRADFVTPETRPVDILDSLGDWRTKGDLVLKGRDLSPTHAAEVLRALRRDNPSVTRLDLSKNPRLFSKATETKRRRSGSTSCSSQEGGAASGATEAATAATATATIDELVALVRETQTLTALDLSDTRPSPTDAMKLAGAVKACATLKSLGLINCGKHAAPVLQALLMR